MTDYSDLFSRAAARGISVLIQNRNPAPQCIGSRNIFAEDRELIMPAANQHGFILFSVNKKAALFYQPRERR